jgi:inward rectifier potassium channel
MSAEQPSMSPPIALGPTEIRVVGAPRAPLRDIYHAFLRVPWWAGLGGIVGIYVVLNALFGLCYMAAGGVANAQPGSFFQAFCFSVQTMGTIGYGALYPVGTVANVLVVLESVVSLMVTAVATGLLFAKFSRVTGRLVFTRQVVIAPMDGVPTLMFRVGNERSNQIMEATVSVVLVRTERTREGMIFYRMLDLPLSRARSAALSRSWTVMHPITEASPLYAKTPDALRAEEVELIVSIVGVDDTSLSTVHARKTYADADVVWGARHADILRETADGSLELDVRRFHELVATPEAPGFPYSAQASVLAAAAAVR